MGKDCPVKTEGLRGAVARRALAVTAIAAAIACVAPAALADEYDSGGFEAFALGNPLGQNGWTANDVGGYNAANFDAAIVDPSAVWGTELGSRALRLSNAVTSGGYGNQLQSANLVDSAGETDAVSPIAGGNRQSRLSWTIKFASATQAYQPGLAVGFAADPGNGARMASFRIVDEPGGFRVDVTTLDESIPDFVVTTIASGLSHTEVHTLQFSLDFVDGVNNDVLWIQTDDDGCNTFTTSGSWEQYHRFYAGNPTPITFPVDTILFRLSGAAQPSLVGGGILFDTVDLSSSTVPAMPAPGVPVVTSAPGVAAVGQHVDVTYATVATNACQPVTSYTATLTPQGGGSPITLTSSTPDFDFDAVPAGIYDVAVTATNAAGESAPSALASVTVAPLSEPSASPDPTITDEDGDGNPDGELANTGPTLAPLGLVALALVALGLVVRRRAA